MVVYQSSVLVPTVGPSLVDVTIAIQNIVALAGVQHGICTVFIRHTSASLFIQENTDPAVRIDFEHWLRWLAPEKPTFGTWTHTDEGPDDMPAHIRSAITRTSETIPILDGQLGLGLWQAVYVCEHRVGSHSRELLITVLGVGRRN